MAIARGGGTWLGTAAALAILAVLGSAWWPTLTLLALPLLLLVAFLAWFFRDPERAVAAGIVSPADGKVVLIDEVEDPDLGPASRLAIFMSPLDVHVNRAPEAASITSVSHVPGGKVPAFRKESERNERVRWHLVTPAGPMVVVQIAGTVARRIVPYLGARTDVARGDRIGLIRLGSRCDVLVPAGRAQWSARVGDRVRAGSSSIGGWR